MVNLDMSLPQQDPENVDVVDMTSVMFIVGNKLYVDLDDVVPDLESDDEDETEEVLRERRGKLCALVAVIKGYAVLEMELGVKVIFIHDNHYFAAGELFNS